MDLKNNVWFFKNVLDKEWCNNLIKKHKKNMKKKGKVGGDGSKISASESKKQRDSNVRFINVKEVYDTLHRYLDLANKNAGWNFKVNWSEELQFTKYGKGQYYDWHIDMFCDPYTNHKNPQFEGKIRKISCSVLLNDPTEYEGGDLEIGYSNKSKTPLSKNKVNLKQCNLGQGSIIFFPAFVWHRVTPVTKGTRYSIVMWTIGPPYV